MDDTWTLIDRELARRRKNWQWLADRMGWTIQRLQNWKTRGVPAKVFPELAIALGRSIDWVAGRSDAHDEHRTFASEPTGHARDHWPFARVTVAQVLDLPPPEFERVQGFIEATVASWEAFSDDRKSKGERGR